MSIDQCSNCPHAHKHWENGEYVIYCDAQGELFVRVYDFMECEKGGVQK